MKCTCIAYCVHEVTVMVSCGNMSLGTLDNLNSMMKSVGNELYVRLFQLVLYMPVAKKF